jgi:hypothetical protein
MIRLYIIFIFLFYFSGILSQSAAPTNYCNSQPSNTDYADIELIKIGPINNFTSCNTLVGSQGTGSGTPDLYTNFTSSSVPIPNISPGSSNQIDVTIRNCFAGMTTNYCGQCKVWIDFNRDGVFQVNNEEFVLGEIPCYNNGANPFNLNSTIVAPNTISNGYTRMRVSWRMYGQNLANITPCGNVANNTTTWGETEDYIVLLGPKKWDYSMESMLSPDSVSFCGQQPVIIKTKVNNVGNQPLTGGRVDLYITGVESGSNTNLYYNKSWTKTILVGQSNTIEFNPILFPKDELVKMTFITYFTLDSNKSNDTLIKYVQVYKNPVYKLKLDTVCADSFNTAIIYDKPLTLFHKWNNESILDTTTYRVSMSSKVSINISRGWKCNVVDSIPIIIKDLPKLVTSRDTTLCNGQQTILSVSMNFPGSVSWVNNGYDTLLVKSSGVYNAIGIANNGCKNNSLSIVSVVNPPEQFKVLDTICANETSKIGFNTNGTDFIYKWEGRNETTPLINVKPSISEGNEKFLVQWWYKGCTSKDSVILKVNPLPNVSLNFPKPICPYSSTTIIASGAKDYIWSENLGIGDVKNISPTTTTDYYVIGIDVNGCFKQVMHRQYVYPKPNIKVFSNKFKDNICLGDSAIIYVNGGKTYNWSNGSSDSVIKITPKETFQWTIIGTDNNGCNDTLIYRMSVKPPLNISFDETIKGCEGDTKKLTISGGKEYNWGEPSGPTTDSFHNINLITSTNYQVTVTSQYDCQVITSIPIIVLKKPVGVISNLTICKGDTGLLEAKGGINYNWNINNQNQVIPNGNLAKYIHTDSSTIGVEIINEAGCRDTVWVSINVIKTDDIEVTFKSPLDSYNCASAKIPITLLASPVGGIWSGGDYIKGDKLIPEGLTGNIQVLYTFFEPINNCKVVRIKNVKFKCVSEVLSLEDNNNFSVYPIPFLNKLNIKFVSEKLEDVNIHIYNLYGVEIYKSTHLILPGENIITLELLNLTKGSYFLKFQTESTSKEIKIITM